MPSLRLADFSLAVMGMDTVLINRETVEEEASLVSLARLRMHANSAIGFGENPMQ